MPQEVVRLVIGVNGDDKAISTLQTLDSLTEKLNKAQIKLNIDTSGLKDLDKEAASALDNITKNINAQARLLEAKNREASVNTALERSANDRATAEAKAAAEAEKTRQAIEKTAQAQAKVQESQVKAFETEAKLAIEAEKTRQAAEKTAQAQAKVEAVEQRRQLLAEQISTAQEKATTQAKAYSDTVESIPNTPLQDQIDALTGVSREFKSAEESAKSFEKALREIEKRTGSDTGNTFDLSGGTNGFRDYLKNVEGIQNATVAATRTVEAGGRTFQQFSASVRNASGDFDNFTYSVDTATGAVRKMDQGMSTTNKTAGSLKQSLGNTVLEFGKWYIIGTIFSSITNSLSEAVQELKNVDAELVNIQKVMDASSAEMEELSEKAFEVGSSLGVAASDYLASVTKWAQAGYGSLSADLGELSVKTQKVGDVQEETANQFLLSVDAAYQYRGNIEALTRVLDGANAISNNYATSVEKLAGGMGIVSSLAAQAGMEVQETMAAIGTITAVTQESGNSAARALRALILNIQGATEIAIDEASGERWTEDEIEATAAALGDLNIATREYKDGVEQLRNPMEVIGELSDKYRKGLISEVQLQEVVSSLGGKVRSNQLQALITNYEMYEDMLATYADSVGSADRELDIYLNSWEAKTNRLQNSWTELVASFQTSDIAKGILDIANAFVQFLNTPIGNVALFASAITALNAALAALEATAGGKAFLSKIKAVPSAIGAIVKSLLGKGGLINAIKGLGSALKSSLGTVGIVLTAIYAIGTTINWFLESSERAAEKVSDLSEEYESGVSALEGYKTQLEEIRDRIEEINGQDTLSFTDEEELKELQAQSKELERQIALQELLNQAKKEELEIAALKALETGYDMENDPNVWSGAKLFLTSPKDDPAREEFMRNWQLNHAGGFEEQAALISQWLDEITQKRDAFLAGNGDDPNTWTKIQLEAFQGIESELAETKVLAGDVYNQLQTNISKLSEGPEKEAWQQVARDLYLAMISAENLATRIDVLTSAMDNATNTEFLEMLSSIQEDGAVTTQEVQELIDKFPILGDALADGKYSLEDLAAFFSEAANSAETFGNNVQSAGEDASGAASAAEALSEALGNLESALKTLQSAQEELSEHGELSLGTVDDLLQKFPALTDLLYEYLAGLVSEQELQQALADQYDQTTNEYKRTILEKMMANNEFYVNTVLTNQEIVSKLASIGLTDLSNYRTLEELKAAINAKLQEQLTQNAEDGRKDREKEYSKEAGAFAKAQASMLAAQTLASRKHAASAEEAAQNATSSFWEDMMAILSKAIEIPSLSFDDVSGSGGGSGASESAQSWYEEQISLLQELISQTQDTNTLLEREEADSYQKRIDNLRAMQDRVHEMADEFRARGLADTSEEVQQLKLMWHDLADDITSIYQEMYDDLMEEHADRQWNLDLFEKGRENADRSVEEITEDCQTVVAEYRAMQEDVHALAEQYRAMGFDETDDLVQNLSDAWWEYEERIESVYESLTNAFEDYISASDRQLKQLERTMGTTGQQIELLYQRIATGKEYLAALQATNVNGVNDDAIADVQDQIWADEDAIDGLQNDLWDELKNAVDKEFDKLQDKIDDAQDQLDYYNGLVEDLDEELQEKLDPLEKEIDAWKKALDDKVGPLEDAIEDLTDEMEDVLEPIEERLEDLNDRLEAEQEALENLVDPLKKQIEGYYTVNPDGTVGVYVPGLNDQIDDLQDQLDEENRKWEEQQKREEEALALQKKELALQEAIKNLEQAQLDLETARNERTVYTLKDGVWAWRPDDQAIQEAEDALEDAEQAKEDAEQALEDLKEEQAHDEIVSLLEDQIEALEKQKEQIEAQIDIYERESAARQEYLQDQIDYYEKEKEAKEDYYNDLIEAHEKEIEALEEYYNERIERNEAEIEALEDYYDKRKEQYDDEIKFYEDEVERLQEEYDAFAERWETIQDNMVEDVRSIEEILADIAKYGTPEMKAQIDNIVGLLTDMGVALGDFNTSIGGGTGGGGGDLGGGSGYQAIVDQMKQNAQAWWEAKQNGDMDAAQMYHNANLQLGASIGATYNGTEGKWYDANGNVLFEIDKTSGGGSVQAGGGSSGGTTSGSSSGTSSGRPSVAVLEQIDDLRAQASRASETEKRSLFAEANSLAVAHGALPIPYTPFVNDWNWYNSAGDWLFDRGGVAEGTGVLAKAVEAPEVVLSPVLAADVLNPVSNEQFDRFARDLGIMFGAAEKYTPDARTLPGGGVTTNHSDSHDTYINGVQLGDSMLDRPLSEILSLLGLYRNS